MRKCAPEESIAVKKIKNATLRKFYNLFVFGHKALLLNTYLTHTSCRVLEGLSAPGLVGCGVGVCGCFVVLLPEELRIRLCRFVVEKTGLRLDLMLKDAHTPSEL